MIERYQRGFLLPGMPNPYFLLAAGIAIAVSFGLGYWRGWTSGVEKYYEFRTKVETEMGVLQAENERKQREAKAVADRAVIDLAAALDELGRRPRIVRVQPVRCPGAVPAVPETPEGIPGLPAGEQGSGAVRTITAEECEARINAGHGNVIWIEQVKKLTDDLHRATGGKD